MDKEAPTMDYRVFYVHILCLGYFLISILRVAVNSPALNV